MYEAAGMDNALRHRFVYSDKYFFESENKSTDPPVTVERIGQPLTNCFCNGAVTSK
jgi:hypothetical protein